MRDSVRPRDRWAWFCEDDLVGAMGLEEAEASRLAEEHARSSGAHNVVAFRDLGASSDREHASMIAFLRAGAGGPSAMRLLLPRWTWTCDKCSEQGRRPRYGRGLTRHEACRRAFGHRRRTGHVVGICRDGVEARLIHVGRA